MRDAQDPLDEATLEAHGRALRALGRRLLGDGDADDLAQDALAAALGAAPSRAPLGAFLKGIARRLAAFRLRTRARRVEREQRVARAEATVSAADAVATAELAQQVAEAVRALPEPYRTTVVLRFWQDLPPRAIAARLGVPVHTVRSRLQRALQMLRARLDARPSGRKAWALPLAAWIDVRPAAATTAASGAAVLGGMVVMITKVRIALVVGCALVLGFALTEHEAGDAAESPAPGGGAGIAVAAELPRAEGSAAAPVERVAAPAVPAVDLVPRATLRGRCVDASGAPLAGCEVVLRGDKANQERMDAWTLDHEPPSALEPAPVVTAADGRFAFSFAPPPPFQFFLEVRAEGRAMLVARWSAIAPGRVVELGDLVMQPGLRLAGRVVDPQGMPVEDALVRARRAVLPSEPSPSAEGVVAPLEFAFAATDAAGRFAIHALVLGGRYRLEVEKVGYRMRETPDGKPRPVSVLPPERGADVLVDAERAQQGIELVLEPVPSAGAISGTVLDAMGAPVARALVQLTDATGSVAGAGASTAEGRFHVELWGPAARGPFRVRAMCEGHEPCEAADPVAAGTTGLELRLGAGAVVTIRVAGPAGGTVDDYAVRMFRRGAGPIPDSRQQKVLARGPFVDGTATVRGTPSGPWFAAVEFPARLGLLPALVPVDIAPGQHLRLDLVAEPGVALEVAVRTQAGAPVPNARIALAQLVEGAFDARTELVRFSAWNRSSGPGRALFLGEATTDAAGQATLQAPRGTELGLHARAAGHVSLRQRGVVVTDARRIELELVAEARLVGQLGPPAFLRQLAADAPAHLAERLQPHLKLTDEAGRSIPDGWRAGGTNVDTDTRVQADGSFSIGALPAGRWRASLVWHPAVHAGGPGLRAGTLRTQAEAPLGTVELRAGATTRLDADLAQQVQGTVDATVFLDGVPLANEQVQLDGPRDLALETDAQGRGRLQLSPGRYRAVSLTHQLECAVDVALDASGAARIVIALVSGTVEATVRDAAGMPASGLHLLFRSGTVSRVATTDAAGRASRRLAPGTWEVSGCTGAWDPAREVRLGTVTVEAGATRSAEWVIPARRDG